MSNKLRSYKTLDKKTNSPIFGNDRLLQFKNGGLLNFEYWYHAIVYYWYKVVKTNFGYKTTCIVVCLSCVTISSCSLKVLVDDSRKRRDEIGLMVRGYGFESYSFLKKPQIYIIVYYFKK